MAPTIIGSNPAEKRPQRPVTTERKWVSGCLYFALSVSFISALFVLYSQIRTHYKSKVLQHATWYTIRPKVHHLSVRCRTLHSIQSDVTWTQFSLRSSHRAWSRRDNWSYQSWFVSIRFVGPTWPGWRETPWRRCTHTTGFDAIETPCKECIMVTKVWVHFYGTDEIPAANYGEGRGESWF